MRTSRATSAALLALATLTACSDMAGPSPLPELVGRYELSEFTITTADTVLDEVAAGVTLRISLAADGSTAGALSVPAASPTPVDLAGRWQRDGGAVTFTHPTLLFIDLLTFSWEDHRLVGAGEVGPGRMRVVLEPAPEAFPRSDRRE